MKTNTVLMLGALTGLLVLFILRSFGISLHYDLFLHNVFGDLKILGVLFSSLLITLIVFFVYKAKNALSKV